MARKRRPGGGRKPIYSKVSNFSTRITAETRGALEAKAAEIGKSVSVAAELLLQLGIKVDRDRKLDDPVRALGFLISGIALFCRSTTKDGRDCDWRTDPSAFEAFRLALATVLERLRPPGKIDTSVEGPLVGRSPEQHAEAVSRLILHSLQTPTEPKSPSEVEAELLRGGPPALTAEITARISAAYSRGTYAWSDVQRELGIKFKETNK
jgi:hypothetical protein